MARRRSLLVVALVAAAALSTPSRATACTELVTDLEEATAAGLPIVEQVVVASSLPLLPLSGRTARVTVRT
jgi:hypothetical protein